jgi:hypothetical protein
MSNDVLAHVYEYRTLVGCRDELGVPLSSAERERLAALERLFQWSSPDGRELLPSLVRRRMARCEVDIAARIVAGGERAATVIVNLGGDGLALDPAPHLVVGTRAVVVVVDAGDAGTEYRFPVEIRWCREHLRHAALGARFASVPILLRRRRAPLSCDTATLLARLRPRRAG